MLIKFLDGSEREIENLSGADLFGANLSRADLSGADLPRADLPTGEKWEQYLSDVVPALLTSGGKTIQQIIDVGAWECNLWNNCPIAEAFSTHSLQGVPILLRPRAEQFIRFFDAHLIPKPVP